MDKRHIWKINYILLALLMVFSACKKKTAVPNEQEQFIKALQGTWQLTEVRKDNALITDFGNFSITFVDDTFTTENGSPVWPLSGSFEFLNEQSIKDFMLMDGREITAEITDETLTIEIAYEPSNARGLDGNYRFVLQKQ